ncbi:MAG: MurR/RpiR family transcriptional regulator [Fusobacteriaceae bacterium]
MIFLKIEKVRETFTKSEKKLVSYLENNSHKIVAYNIMELSERSGISAPSIIRFAKKLGYDGFIDMRIALGKLSNKENMSDKKHTSMIEFFRSSLLNTLNFSDEKIIENTSEILKNSKKIAVLGVDGLEDVGRTFYKNLLNKNFDAIWDSSLEILEKLTKKFTEKDSLIVFSHFGENSEVVEMIKKLLEKEVTIISVTKAEKNSLGIISDINIPTDNTEKAAKINQMAISEVLIDCI